MHIFDVLVGSGVTPPRPPAPNAARIMRLLRLTSAVTGLLPASYSAGMPKERMSMPKSYVSSRVEVMTTKAAGGQILHDTRAKPPAYCDSTIPVSTYLFGLDREFEVDTQDLAEDTAILKRIIKRSAEEQQQRYLDHTHRRPDKQRGNWFIRGVITFSPSGIPPKESPQYPAFCQRLAALAQDYIQRIANEWEVNPIYLTMHMDETTVHVHYMLESAHKDTGKSQSRRLNRQLCTQLQDWAGEAFASLGFARGEKKSLTGAQHQNVKQSHAIQRQQLEAQEEALQRDVNELTQQLDTVTKARKKQERRAAQAQAEADALNDLIQERQQEASRRLLEHYDAQERMKNLLEATERLEGRLKRLRREAKEIHEKVTSGEVDLDNILMEHQLMKTYLEEKGLNQDFEDWASAYLEAQKESQEQDLEGLNLEW